MTRTQLAAVIEALSGLARPDEGMDPVLTVMPDGGGAIVFPVCRTFDVPDQLFTALEAEGVVFEPEEEN